MHRLCNEDISKLESITKINLFECLTWLTYETDLENYLYQIDYDQYIDDLDDYLELLETYTTSKLTALKAGNAFNETFSPVRPVFTEEEPTAFVYNETIDTDGDGIRDKDGISFEFTFSVSSGSTSSKYLALMLKEDLRKVGIVVNIRQLEWSVYVENLRDRQFDVVSLLWIGGLEMDPYQIWHSDNIGDRGSNYMGFRNAEADSLIHFARFEMDKETRNEMYFRLQEILHEEQPYTFMFYQRDPGAYLKEFEGVKWLPIRPGYKLGSWWRNSSRVGENL